MANRVLKGKVVRSCNAKTVTVSVETSRLNPLYKKYQVFSRNYHVHDEDSKYKVGDVVHFKASKPISKTKKWIVCEG